MRILPVIFILLFAGVAEAQSPDRRVDVRLTGGWTTFADEGPVNHSVVGGSMRFYLTRRFSFEPELLYLRGPRDDRDLTFIPQVAYDFGSSTRVIPYVIGGVGVLRHSRRRFSNAEITVSGGLGLKIYLTDKIFVAQEGRVGFEPILRATGSIGYTF